jgi:hypothetical protein
MDLPPTMVPKGSWYLSCRHYEAFDETHWWFLEPGIAGVQWITLCPPCHMLVKQGGVELRRLVSGEARVLGTDTIPYKDAPN